MATGSLLSPKADPRSDRSRPAELAAPDGYRRRVRLTRLVVAMVVIISSAVLGWLVLQSQQVTAEVWVARVRLDAGAVVGESDVMLSEVDKGSMLSAVSGDTLVVGRTVRVPVPEGSTFVDGHFFSNTDALATPGMSQISIVFPLGHITLSVAQHDLVRIVVIPSKQGEPEVFDEVAVGAVQHGERTGHVVTVVVPVEVGDRLIEALANGEVWASVVGRA